MLELEALLLGLEPLTALAVGVGALIITPVIGVVGSAIGSNSSGENPISDSFRSVAKTGLVWTMDAAEKVQTFAAETGESFQDLMAEAQTERRNEKAKAEQTTSFRPVEVG